jgi:hypothetical protein
MPDRPRRHNSTSEHDPACNCLACRIAWEEWHEAKYRWRLAVQETTLRHAKPATDEEWQAFLDSEYPQAKDEVA